MRLQAQREACLDLIHAAHSLSESIYPALLEIVRRDGVNAETPPDFLKEEQSALRAAVDRLELEGPVELVPLANAILEAARQADEDCMMEVWVLGALYKISGGFIRISRLFTLSRELTESFDEEITEKIRHAIIDEDSASIQESLQPLVEREVISQFTAGEISRCNWDWLVQGMDGGLEEARKVFTQAANGYLAERQNPAIRWLSRRWASRRATSAPSGWPGPPRRRGLFRRRRAPLSSGVVR
ncbi:hypothetical protein [Streptomyces sp. 8ZJF_21]|uniref:hypothetical protein n=1 Tax=Streptomyces sp. 8ZJF_21 TaxID=2903141 RepID=UPI001E578474|nr:hypothetical protein [Streptomyces sp. 8ZJF_21]MCD9590865.1 hypothetical protein [Streptomyces sp. 8ZJF_21]